VSLNARQRQTLVWAVVGVLLLWLLAALGPVLTPFVAGGVLAYALQPGVAWLARHRVPRALGAALVLLVSLCTGRDPVEIAAQIGDGGGGGLKKLVTEAVNEFFAPIRARRAELVADPGYLLDVLRRGNAHANEIGDATLSEVRAAMNMSY